MQALREKELAEGKQTKLEGIDNSSDLQAAISLARLDPDNIPLITVTEDFFKLLEKRTGSTPWIMYQDVPIYKVGTVEGCQANDARTEVQARFPRGM